MIRAFKERRPWAAALVNLIFGPFLGMLYLGRGGIAFLYLILGFGLAALLLFFFPLVLTLGSTGTWLASFPLNVIGMIQGTYLARKRSTIEPLPRYARWYSLVGINLAFFIVAFAIRAFLYQPFSIPSAAMEPSLNIGDYFFVSKRAYDNAGPQRGDVVVFKMPNPNSPDYNQDFVKRVIGLPGDRVQMINGQVFLNSKPIPKKRVADYIRPDEFGVVRNVQRFTETLPSGRSYYVLDLGPNSNEDNTGIFVVPAGHYFMMGDNRDNSDDSRMSVGFVPAEDLVGKAVVKFVDGQHKTMIWDPVD